MCLAFTLLLTRSIVLHFAILLLLCFINVVIELFFSLIGSWSAITYLKRLWYCSLVLIPFTYGAQSLADFRIEMFTDSESFMAYGAKNIRVNTYCLCRCYVPLGVFP